MNSITMLSAFDVVQEVTDYKIAKTFNDFIGARESLPSIPYIPGMDLTDNGRVLTNDELVKLRNAHSNLTQERLALQTAFASVRAQLMIKETFYHLVDTFDLFVIPASPTNDTNYRVTLTRAPSESTIWNIRTLMAKSQEVGKINIIKRRNFFNKISYGALEQIEGLRNKKFIIPILIAFLWLNCFLTYPIIGGIVMLFFTYQIFMCKKYNNLYSKREILKLLFKGNRIQNRSNNSNSGFFADVKVSVIPPPEPVRKIIVNTISKLPALNNPNARIITVADPRAINVEISEVVIPAPTKTDPGIAIEYKNYVVVLPDTFYHITDMEERFLEVAKSYAENWDPIKYLLN